MVSIFMLEAQGVLKAMGCEAVLHIARGNIFTVKQLGDHAKGQFSRITINNSLTHKVSRYAVSFGFIYLGDIHL